MFIKLTKTDGTAVWLNPDFIVRIEAWKKGSAVAAAGDGDFEVMETPRAIFEMVGGAAGGTPATTCAGKMPATPIAVEMPATPIKGEPATTVEAEPHKRKTRTRRKAETEQPAEVAEAPKAEAAPEPTPAPVPESTPAPEPVPEPAPVPSGNLFPEPPDEVAVAAAILKKQRCRSRKRIQNTIKSMNPKMSMDAARALLEQMEARGFVIIDAQGHATFT